MTAAIAAQLHAAATWAEEQAPSDSDAVPGFKATAKPLRWLARRVVAGDIDLSRLPPPSPTESPWGGLLARLRRIGIDVVEMCPRAEEAA